MGESLAHRWGQILGEIFESAWHPVLAKIAAESGVYMDYSGNMRPTRKGGTLKWQDAKQNWHRLDYVFERGGQPNKIGTPTAFIELAWRRYTKHSKNKVQEIEGAVIPLAETYRHNHPFLGAILGGVFTKNSLAQLSSRGFSLIYVPTSKVIEAFSRVNIDASCTERTPESEYAKKIRGYEALTPEQRGQIETALVLAEPNEVAEFVRNLKASLGRKLDRVIVLPLHGESHVSPDIENAIAFVSAYDENAGSKSPLVSYEIEVRYSNGAVVRGSFPTKTEAVAFLRAQ